MSDQRIQDHLRNYLIFQINREKIFHEDEKKHTNSWEKNKYNICPVLFRDTCFIQSEEFPIMDIMIKNILEEEAHFSFFTEEFLHLRKLFLRLIT